MLDKKTEKLLQKLNQTIGTSYKVVEKQQLEMQLGLDKNGLASLLSLLKENDLLTVKYQDKDEICIAMTVKAESYFDDKKMHSQKATLSGRQLALVCAVAFLGAFLGAILAVILTKGA